jgi:hypothetical protein
MARGEIQGSTSDQAGFCPLFRLLCSTGVGDSASIQFITPLRPKVRPVLGEPAVVELCIVAGHTFGCEVCLKVPATFTPVGFTDAMYRVHRLLDILDMKATDAVRNDLGKQNRPASRNSGVDLL